jgi:hypothetical protein
LRTKNIEIRFGARTFPLADILWGLEQAKEEGPLAREALALGRNLVKTTISNKDCLEFSELVCRWGRGERVFANLRRHHGPKLGTVLSKALTHASNATDAESAIAPLCAIKGLGVSFASKHLRMMLPDRFGVLDSRFEETLGFAMNVPGYMLFMKHLGAFRDELDCVAPKNFKNLPISTVENGLFFLVQPKAIMRLQQDRLK